MRWPLASPQHLIGYCKGAPIISPILATIPPAMKELITGKEEQANLVMFKRPVRFCMWIKATPSTTQAGWRTD